MKAKKVTLVQKKNLSKDFENIRSFSYHTWLWLSGPHLDFLFISLKRSFPTCQRLTSLLNWTRPHVIWFIAGFFQDCVYKYVDDAIVFSFISVVVSLSSASLALFVIDMDLELKAAFDKSPACPVWSNIVVLETGATPRITWKVEFHSNCLLLRSCDRAVGKLAYSDIDLFPKAGL